MIFISILILIVAIALPSKEKKQLFPILFIRISSIIFLYAGALSFNAFYIQSIGSGIGIYSGLFHITVISQFLELFLLLIGSLILISWPIIINTTPALAASETKSALANINNQPAADQRELLAKAKPEAAFVAKAKQISTLTTPASQQPKKEKFSTILNSNILISRAGYPNLKNSKAIEYSLIVLFSTLGASLLISSSDLISMYLSIELQSFGLYILATLYRNSESATSAGLKYFLLGGLSSCIILLGTSLIYTYTGLTHFESIYNLISVLNNNNIIQGFTLGFIFIIIGFLFKIAAAPLHNWAPDVYDDSPTIVTIWLTIMPKISILILLLELQTQIGFLNNISALAEYNLETNIYQVGFSGHKTELLESISVFINNISAKANELLSPIWEEAIKHEINTSTQLSTKAEQLKQTASFWSAAAGADVYKVIKLLLLISSLFSLIIGTVVGLAQTKIKRLLAYSTISHVGFILLALVINTEQSIDSFIFYIIQYSMTNLNTFLIIIALGYIIQASIKSITPATADLALAREAAVNYSTAAKAADSLSNQPNQLSLALATKGSRTFGSDGFSSSRTTQHKQINNLNSEIEILSDIRFISEFKNQFLSNPLLSLSLSISLFSMAGIPPLIGFFAKQFVLYSAIQNGYYFISIIAIMVSVISASYYLKIIKVLYTDQLKQNFTDSASGSASLALASGLLNPSRAGLSNFHSFTISTLTLTIILFVLKPSIILNSTQLLSLSLYLL